MPQIKAELPFSYRISPCLPEQNSRHETAWRLLYELISERYGIDGEELKFAKNENGKPLCVSHPGVRFSIAHAKDFVAVCVSDFNIGIDCECERNVSARIKEKMLSLPSSAPDGEAVLRWCYLESYVKMNGGRVFGMTYETVMQKEKARECELFRIPYEEDKTVTVCLSKSKEEI